MTWGEHGPVVIVRCCRDWPTWVALHPLGKCGFCGEVPQASDKTVEQYMAERKVRADG